MKPGQEKIYYILGDDERSLLYSPHLDIVRNYDYEVLLLTDPVDPIMLVRLHQYGEYELENVAAAKLEPRPDDEAQVDQQALAPEEHQPLIERFTVQLGERVSGVRMTDRLTDSPARLVDPEGAPNQEMQRVYRLLNKEFEAPKKTLELNPRHPILVHLHSLAADHPLNVLIIEQVYEDALLIEGLHPDPASMIGRIQKIMEAALKE
jgi:molecular chaperone HtpG